MKNQEISEFHGPMETPGRRTGGLPFIAPLIPLVVVISSLFLTRLLSQVQATPFHNLPDDNNGSIAPLFTPEVQYWDYKILPWSETYRLDPNLIATVMQIESCGHPKAESSAGAMGLFQVMPYHFSGEEDPYKPNINARRGLNYLKRALEAGQGDIRLALAGYNGGINGASNPESNWPAETQRYVYWGIDIFNDAKQGKTQSKRLEEWLNAGGASLCRSAAENLNLDG
jgi:soluble lytic murein transglycosylase-like protein